MVPYITHRESLQGRLAILRFDGQQRLPQAAERGVYYQELSTMFNICTR